MFSTHFRKGVSDLETYMDYFTLSGRSCEKSNFLPISFSSQVVPEHSYFGHGKGFWRSNSFSVQLRIRKQKELIRKRREIDFTSRELSRNFITAVMCLLSLSLTFLVLLSSTKIEIMKVERLLQSSLRSYYANLLLPSRDHTSTPERIC